MAVIKNMFNRKPMVMGILNVTPDSFSDGGKYTDPEVAITFGLEMIANGADILDIGGESSRPGSTPVSTDEELRRVIPVVAALAARTDAILSVDTVRPEVADAALAAGARMLNDVSTLQNGDDLARIAARTNSYLILMHSRGTPQNMSNHAIYEDVIREVSLELSVAAEKAAAAGVPRENIWLDPGIGFAKNTAQNIEILGRLDEIAALGYPVLVGPSRKSFIGEISGADVHHRMGGTAAAVTAAILFGAYAVRVHDVAMMRQTALVANAVFSARSCRATKRVSEVCRHV